MRHPAHFFIKFLLTGGTHVDTAWVVATVESHSLPIVMPEYVDRLKAEMADVMPADFRPRDKRHRESIDFLRAERIYSLHHPDDEVRAMQERILFEPVMRHHVDTLLLGKLSPGYAAERLNKRYKCLLSERSVALYMHYFFNSQLLTDADWSTALSTSSDQNEAKIRMSIVKTGAPVALYRAGIRQVVESKQVLKHSLLMASMRLHEVNQLATNESCIRMMNSLIRTLLAVDERLSQSDVALKEVLDEFRKFTLETSLDAPISIGELAPEGNYSGSGEEEKNRRGGSA